MIVPAILFVKVSIIFDALLLTAGTVAGLGLVAWTAPSEAFLNVGGFCGMSLSGIATIAFLMIRNPTLFWGINVYGGIVLFSGLMLYDLQKMIKAAKTKYHFDPMMESIDLYLDAVNFFVRIVLALSKLEGASEHKNEKKHE
jgi:FtsH-binding integral membrane protein